MLEWDKHLLLWINSHHHPLLDAVLVPVAYAGEVAAIWVVVFVAMLIWGKAEHRKTALLLAVTMIIVDRCISAPLGAHFDRVRPYLALEGVRQIGIAWKSSSFPSGHAHSVWLTTVILGSRWSRLRLPLIVFALLTCYSRPYLGMHYPLDVVAGSLIGTAVGFAALGVEKLWCRRGARGETENVESET